MKPFDPTRAVEKLLLGGCPHGGDSIPRDCFHCLADALRTAYWEGVGESTPLEPCVVCEGAGARRAPGIGLVTCSECRGLGKVSPEQKKPAAARR